MAFQHKPDLLGLFAQHKVAANLLMLIMILAGFWALDRLNIQFMPNFNLDVISVRVIWTGAGAEDVEASITNPLEQELNNLDGVKKMTSTSANGLSSISLEYHENTDMGVALDQVKESVAQLTNLPLEAEQPQVSRVIRHEPIARLLLSGNAGVDELRTLAQRLKDELLAEGISKIEINGLPEQELAIQVPSAKLEELGMTLAQIAAKVNATSRDLPAGVVGRDDVARELRSLDQRRDENAFRDIPVSADNNGRLLTLGDIATIELRPKNGESRFYHQNKRVLELRLFRAENDNALDAAEILHTWAERTRPTLPKGLSLHIYDESWKLIKERIMLLLVNGGGGLILVILILFLFLNGRVAWWVAVGIPVSLLATQAALYLSGGSINMVSLFGMIMALGIIVDDAIVVGEDALAHYQNGEHPLQAAEGGARRMLAPVMASSLTTIAAFLPLMMVGGIMGKILFAIPLVLICVIIASLIESFWILPGHLTHSFRKVYHKNIQTGALRTKLDDIFTHFRDGFFFRLVNLAVRYRWVTLGSAVAMLVLGAGLLAGGRLNFTFFPSPDGTMLSADIAFVAGTPPQPVESFVQQVEQSLYATDKEFGGGIVKTAVTRYGTTTADPRRSAQSGDQYGSLLVELSSSDERDVRNQEFLDAWRKKITHPPGLESFVLTERRGGPPGRDIAIRLSGNQPAELKKAALELADALETYPGISAIEDDMPYGRDQLIYRLRPQASALGLTVTDAGRQLRAAFDGNRAQIYIDGKDEIEVRVVLPDAERHRLDSLNRLNLKLPNGSTIPLDSAVELLPQRGFDALRHYQGELSVQIYATVDKEKNNIGKVLAGLEKSFLPDLSSRYSLRYNFEGRAADQKETLADMGKGLVLALILIYLILAWVFSSYGWPLIVMTAIPFGLIGALAGHFIMGYDMTVLSLFGFFALSGIVVNDSIVLVIFYKHLREAGSSVCEALTNASRQRLRAVLLTSLTTIGGLLPLLFETSMQAQFLIPMALSISFGLMFSTVLVLLVVPALLSVYEDLATGEGSCDTPSLISNMPLKRQEQ